MSLSQIRTKTEKNLLNLYEEFQNRGAVMPAQKNMDNLLECAKSISEITYYTVDFITMTDGFIEPQTIVHGHTITPVVCPPKEGYTFKYWTVDGIPFSEDTPITSDVVLEAFWEANNVILMGDTSTSTYILGGSRASTKLKKEWCRSITFLVNADVPTDAVLSWDVSEKNDGSIMAYANTRSTSTAYDLYIIGNGPIELPLDSSYLFANYKTNALKTINNIGMLITSNTKNMSHMFDNSYGLQTLNIGSWDVSNVTDMSYMFYSTSAMQSFDLNNWDVSNVINMTYMFAVKSSSDARTFNIDNWDVSNVTNMSYMFHYSKATTLDLSGWHSDSLVDANYMFINCSLLETLDVRNMTFSMSSGRPYGNNASLNIIYVKNETEKEYAEKYVASTVNVVVA